MGTYMVAHNHTPWMLFHECFFFFLGVLIGSQCHMSILGLDDKHSIWIIIVAMLGVEECVWSWGQSKPY
jgi:hypothetical protein